MTKRWFLLFMIALMVSCGVQSSRPTQNQHSVVKLVDRREQPSEQNVSNNQVLVETKSKQESIERTFDEIEQMFQKGGL